MAFLLETIWLGLKNLRLHMLRSVLTALGIIFGVGAVITMVALGEGNKRAALSEIEQLGARNVIVRSQRPPESASSQGGSQRQGIIKYGLTYEDFRRLEVNFTDADFIVPLKQVGAELLRGEKKLSAQAFGTTADLQGVANLRIARGRYLIEQDLHERGSVVVIGHEIARILFPLDDPLGETFRIDQHVVTVVGVLEPIGLAGGAGAALVGRDLNKDVHMPLTTAQAVFGDILVRRQSGSFQASEVQLHEVYLAVPSRETVLRDAARARRIIEVGHRSKPDVEIIIPYELLESARKTAVTYNLIMVFIAGISLLVGGIGIMNIMLANVTERTREIGIRRALGATRRNIVVQFLVETGVLSMAGGVIGIVLGIAVAEGIEKGVPMLVKLPIASKYLSEGATFQTQVTGWSIVLSFVVAAATGLIFGIYPARVAARQDPIVALRHD
ncbi:MAG: ABC transporter permease [Phycisphaerales bacterium]|nr:ABC transporter permease [Phycisphaerales bacterium]